MVADILFESSIRALLQESYKQPNNCGGAGKKEYQDLVERLEKLPFCYGLRVTCRNRTEAIKARAAVMQICKRRSLEVETHVRGMAVYLIVMR